MGGPPTVTISFKLSRGEYATFIADYQQRKIVEIFENADEKQEGELSLDKIEVMDLANKFQANSQQCEKGKEFFIKHDGEICGFANVYTICIDYGSSVVEESSF